jgi:hypothetical protein
MAAGFYASANGTRVVALDVLIPYVGLPVADISTADGPAPAATDPVTLTIGNLTMACSVWTGPVSPRSGVFAGSGSMRLVGGAGGWSRKVSLSPYRAPPGTQTVLRSTVLRDLAAAAKGPSGSAERVTLAAGMDKSLGAFYVPETGAEAGRQLAAVAGRVWWMDFAGVTQVAAARPAATITTASTIGDMSFAKGRIDVATEDPRAWVPGTTFVGPTVPGGVLIAGVRLHAGPDGVLRVEALTA